MFSSASRTALRTIQQRAPLSLQARAVPGSNSINRAFFGTTRKMESKKVDEYKGAGNREDAPPKHEAVYFKGLMSEKRAFGDFRTVLHTSLYSQIVAMEVPVGGEIGDEVCCSHVIPTRLVTMKEKTHYIAFLESCGGRVESP